MILTTAIVHSKRTVNSSRSKNESQFLTATKWKYFRINLWVKVRWDWSATGTRFVRLASSRLISQRVRFPKHANLSVGSHRNLPTTGRKKSDPRKTRHRARCKTTGFRCSFHILARSDRRRGGIALQVRCPSTFNRPDDAARKFFVRPSVTLWIFLKRSVSQALHEADAIR